MHAFALIGGGGAAAVPPQLLLLLLLLVMWSTSVQKQTLAHPRLEQDTVQGHGHVVGL